MLAFLLFFMDLWSLDWVRIPTQLNTSKRGPKYLPKGPRYQGTPICFNCSTKYLPGISQMPPKSGLGTTLAPHLPPFEHRRPPHRAPNASKVVSGHQSGPPLDHPWARRGKRDRKQWFVGRASEIERYLQPFQCFFFGAQKSC